MSELIIRVGPDRDRTPDDTPMTENATSHAPHENTPAGLDVDDVAVARTEYVHEDADYCARDTDGRVVVGVTNDAGEVLLLVDADRSHAILPNCHVEDGDWEGVARETVAESTGVPVALHGPSFVRVVDHRLEGEEEPRERTYHVVFAASPESDGADTPEPSCDDPEWSAGWYDEVPVVFDDGDSDVLADIGRFLD